MICDFYFPYLGGVEQHVRSLAHALAGAGHEVAVATIGRDDLPAQEHDGDVRIFRMRSLVQRLPFLHSSADRPWAPPFPDPSIAVHLRRIVHDFRPDIVHGHDWLARSFAPWRRRAARRYGTRLVTSLHYYTVSCARKNLMELQDPRSAVAEVPCTGPGPIKCLVCSVRNYGPVMGPVVAAGNRVAAAIEVRTSDAIVAVSAATATGNGLAIDERTVHVIPNFLPVAAAVADERVIEDHVALLPHGPFILFVGDLRPMKGLDVLLDAYRGLPRPIPLVLIGKRWPDTPTELPQGVVVHDRWPNLAVLEAWRRSVIAAVPSVWAEPFGIVLIEAMAGGNAVVASRVGGIPDVLLDGRAGVLVPPGDACALADELQALIDDPLRRRQLADAARLRARSYSAESVVPQIVELYLRVRSDGESRTER